MAPKRGESIERNSEYDEFMKNLAEYHQNRGTVYDPEPKVGVRHIDLLKLYTRVVDEGGYDLVSDTKAKPLMWRKLAEEFVGKNPYTAAQAFQVKQVYYKQLVAYEITNHWKKEPPPKEILEDLTAKGGNVMGRTLETFQRPPTKEEKLAQEGDESDASPEQKTPREEKTEILEDPGSAAGARSSRGLRQQPPQRVLFQPDLNPGRQTRGQMQGTHASPTPGGTVNGIMNPSTMAASSTLASYEPPQSYPLSLKPVTTPANNPEYYRNERKRKLEATAGPLARKYRNVMLPGTGFIGPNIYVRAQLGLQSGNAEEEQYALHHLVKISHERGDKYKFDQFPGLSDALVKKVLSVSKLFYDIEWDVNYDEETFPADDETLNGLDGTSNLLSRVTSRVPLITTDSVLDTTLLSQLNRINEACLIVRNMCMLPENAQYAARMPIIQDMITVVLNLPRHHSVLELRHYVLDIAEQTLKYCNIGTQDDLYRSLLAQLTSEDRGIIATSLRVISRIGMALPPPKRLEKVSPETLRRVQNLLLVEDEELRGACLDFLMQYTSFVDNVDHLLQSVDGEALSRQLSRLLLFDARESKPQDKPSSPEVDKVIPPVPRLSRSVVETLLKLEEPERSSEWLRMCFSPDVNSEMTQISLWQAYQGTFAAYQSTHPHLIAGEFIKNVSAVFTGATAQVAGQNKYVIRGIRARKAPVETGTPPGSKPSDKGKELSRCRWKVTYSVDAHRDPLTGTVTAPTQREADCGEWFRNSEDMLRHVLSNHLRLPNKKATSDPDKMDVDAKPDLSASGAALPNSDPTNSASNTLAQNFDFAAADKSVYRCRWAECSRNSSDFPSDKVSRTVLFARHIQTHLPDLSTTHAKHNITPSTGPAKPAKAPARTIISTLTDEGNDAAGLPLGAALVLRNIARFMPKTLSSSQEDVRAAMGVELDAGDDDTKLIDLVFDEQVKEKLFEVVAKGATAKGYAAMVLRNVRRSGG